jgi:hypothetical protein
VANRDTIHCPATPLLTSCITAGSIPSITVTSALGQPSPSLGPFRALSNSPKRWLSYCIVSFLANFRGCAVDSSDRFKQNRTVIEEFAARWLSSLHTDLGRLIYVSKLRDIYAGTYRHPFLEEKFSNAAVDQALAFCHAELFSKFLENSFERQALDLRLTLTGMELPPEEIAARWLGLELYCSFVPTGAPIHQRVLFVSKIRSMLAALVGGPVRVAV